MPEYGNFENGPVSLKPLSVERKLASFQPRGIEKDIYVQLLGLLLIAKFYAQI